MNRACRSVPGRSYFSEPNIRNKLDLPNDRPSVLREYPTYGANVGDWVKQSIMGDVSQVHTDSTPYSPQSCTGCYPGERRPRDEMESVWLMQQTQQIAQTRNNDGCTCSQYAPEVLRCTCQFPGEQKTKVKVEPISSNKQHCYGSQTAEQDVWMTELLDIESQQERLRLQKEKLYQSLAVPDPSLEYPYYMGYHDDSSIYEQEPPPMQLVNNLPDKPSGFSTFQRVPKSTKVSTEASPVSSPPPKSKSSRPRLCHFLLELLANPQQYSDVVEWVDKEKGVFKFLNSSEVASQWGRRRNKPHMKYENFARSLRTYIAKGILTKPRSKLVYRFTNKVY